MSSRLRAFAYVLCLLALPAGTQAAAAASWQEQRDAGNQAFSEADYAGSAERFAAALTAAREGGAKPEDLGAILERLTTAYFAVRQFSRAEASIAEWDAILAEEADQPWAAEQRGQRDVLALLVSEVRGQTEPEAPPEASVPAAPPPVESAAVPSQGAAAAPDPEADEPFEPDQPFLMPQSDSPVADSPVAASPGAATEVAAVPPSAPTAPRRTAIHLVSLKDPEGAATSWGILQKSYPDVLAGKDLEVRRVELEGLGTYYRLYAVPFPDKATAGLACEALERSQQYCVVVTLD